jgi:threonine dehydratase
MDTTFGGVTSYSWQENGTNLAMAIGLEGRAEPEGANDTFLSLAAGERVLIPHPDTIADGLRSPKPGELTFPVLQRLLERVLLVSDNEMRAAVKFMLLRLKILVEPSGASSVAAVLFRKLPPEIRSVGVVISGGNVDFEELVKY